MPTGLYM